RSRVASLHLSPYTTLFRSLYANEAISSGPTATSSSGSVRLRKRCQELAPSTSAASYISCGIDCSAPVQINIMYGKPSHNWISRRSEEHTSELQSRENLVCR